MATASDRFLESESPSPSGPREALFVDRRAPDFHELIEGARPGMRVVVLDPRGDALTQIADTLERECCDMVHIVAHGAPGAIAFSSGNLSAATLRDHASALARIGAALPADAEILLWSCEVGLGAVGARFLDVLSDLTGAYVAGATHNLGAGAPWTLDAARRSLAAEVPFTAETIATYQGTLATRLWYTTHGEDATDAGLDRINANGTNQQIPAVDDTTHGLGSAWQEVVIDQANNLYFILEYDLTGQTATLYQGFLNSAAAPTARHTFDAADIDIVRGLEIDTVNHRLYVGQLDFDNDTDFNIVAASTGILQMDYNTTTGVVTNTNNFLVTQASDPLADGFYAPTDFALGDGSLFFVQQADSAGANQLYRVDLTTQNVNVVLSQAQFPTNFTNGRLQDVEIDTTNDLLYFTTHGDPNVLPSPAAENKIWFISTSATGSTNATQLTLTGFSDANFFPGDLTFDPVARRLYVESEGTSDGGGNGAGDDVIYVFQLDGPGTSASLVSTFNVSFATDSVANIGGMALTQNAAPTLADLNNVTFLENTVNATPQLIDATVTFNEPDDANLNGGNLTITYSSGGSAQDNLSVRNIGNGAGQIGVSGTTVSFGGVAIGTITTNGASGANLVITLNQPAATVPAVDALIQALQYQNTSDTPTATRTISVTVNDGQGGTSAAATSIITVTAENDLPTLAGLNNVTFLENTVNAAPQIIDSTVVFTDADSTDLNGGNLTVTYSSGGSAQDNLSIANQGTGAGQIGISGTTVSYQGVAIGTITTNGASGANLVVSLNASASPTAVDALIQALQYQNTSNTPTATRTISITVNDGDGGTSVAATSIITVTAENDAPTGITGGPFSVAEFGVGGSANGTVVGTVTAQDPDGSSGFTYSFAVGGDAGGRFTIDPSSGQISVLDGTLLDFEQNTSHNVTVHVVDSGGLSPAADTVFAIDVSDVTPEDVTGNGNPNTFHGGPGDDTLRGLAGVDTLVGNEGKDILNGGTGGDSMQGGLGDDVYFADDPADAANENVAEGADRVFASVSYTLTAGSEIEILTTTDHAGSGAINLTGNGFANFIYGNAGVNTLDGAGGSDVLVGNNGDTLIGGQGDDTLISAPGVDTMNGGTDNDQYFVDEAADIVNEVINEGSDRVWAAVSYALAAGSEIETLTTTFHFGTAAINLTGNEFTNFILGNDGDNVINGGAGADTVGGRAGNDQFFVDDASDVVLESVGGGSDRVFATVNYTLTAGSEVEILTTNNHFGLAPINLTGNEFANFINGNAGINTLDGSGGADVLIGNGGDTLIGGEGDDTLIGGAGVDTMTGGNGNDQYFVDAAGDVVNESAGQGNDRVWTSVSYTLAAASEIETFTTTNQLGVDLINLTGNEFGQFVAGNDGNNVIDGDGGNDTLTGRAGDDDFVYAATSDSNETSGLDRITDFSGTDQLSFAALGLTTDKSAIINKGTAAYVSSSADFFDNGGTDFAVAVQTNGDTTRVYADSNGDGNYTVGSDLAIEFSGNILANLNSTSDYIFV